MARTIARPNLPGSPRANHATEFPSPFPYRIFAPKRVTIITMHVEGPCGDKLAENRAKDFRNAHPNANFIRRGLKKTLLTGISLHNPKWCRFTQTGYQIQQSPMGAQNLVSVLRVISSRFNTLILFMIKITDITRTKHAKY